MFTWLVLFTYFIHVESLCGVNVRWSHYFNMEDVYGMWYGVGYAQHNPDITNRPKEVGCVTLFITDATSQANSLTDFSPIFPEQRRNYADENWGSANQNPWSNIPLSGSWLDVRLRLRRRVKRDGYKESTVRVIWDEDGQTMEQSYAYSREDPGLWTAEEWRPMEKELLTKGIEVWYPDDPPRHPDVIRILKVTHDMLIINHCSEVGDGGIFSLILRRSPDPSDRAQWYDLLQYFYKFDLPHVYRHAAVCAGCDDVASVIFTVICVSVARFI